MKKILYSIGLSLVIVALLFSAIGCEGPVGPQGIQGIQGETGAIGPQGSQGVKGDTGEPGTGISITWMGTATSAPKSWRVLNYAYYNSYKGKSYIWDGNSWEIWARDGATGATGATGPRGYTGAPGADGADGANGAEGLPGPQGKQGEPGAPGAAGADCIFPYTIQMGTYEFTGTLRTITSELRWEIPFKTEPAFSTSPLVFVNVVDVDYDYMDWEFASWINVVATDIDTEGFTVKASGSEGAIGKDIKVTVCWLAISQ